MDDIMKLLKKKVPMKFGCSLETPPEEKSPCSVHYFDGLETRLNPLKDDNILSSLKLT